MGFAVDNPTLLTFIRRKKLQEEAEKADKDPTKAQAAVPPEEPSKAVDNKPGDSGFIA